MSEEEKKAIEGLKHTAENPESKFWIGTQGMKNIQIVLNLIEKLQKEIERKNKLIEKNRIALENCLKYRSEEDYE